MSGARLLAVWLTPVLWLEMPALILGRGPEGLWIGLALMLAPLVVLGAGPRAPIPGEPEPLFPVVILLLTVGVVFWANLILAGDVAVWLGAPRWQGIAIAAGGGWLLTAWRGGARIVPALLLATAVALSAPLTELVRAAGVGPLEAWARVATQPSFRFPSTSPWVAGGRDLRIVQGHSGIVFDEEHRITAPAGGRILARTQDGGRVADLEWILSPGQSVILRPGDRLQDSSAPRLRFESGKRVPGAPSSGMAWAAGQPPDGARRAGLLVTLLVGAFALCRARAPARASRSAVALVVGGGLMAFLWSQGWAVYSLLVSPDLFLGGVTPERLLALPGLGDGNSARSTLQASLLAGGLASFLASSIALRERLGALDWTGGGEIGHDLGLWTGVFAVAGLASLWPLDPWSLTLLALGAAASSLGPTALGTTAAPSRASTLVGLVGLAVFTGLAVAGKVRGGAEGLLGAVLAYPALVAVPAAALVLWICRPAVRR